MRPLSQHVKRVLCLKPSTALETSTGQDGAEIDMTGFDTVEFIGTVAAVTGDATVTLSVRGSTASGGTFAEMGSATVSTTTGQKDGLLSIELDRPTKRYLKPRIVRAAAASGHGGIVALLSAARDIPTTNSSTSMLQSLVRVEHST